MMLISALTQKLKHHEERLHSQQQQLATLQSREPSPVSAPHTVGWVLIANIYEV